MRVRTKGKRPRVLTRCVADTHAVPGERIVEFSFPDGSGGLLSLRTMNDGTNVAEFYRCQGVSFDRKTGPQ